MSERGFALFETAIGCCGIAWGERGVIGVQLPEGDAAASRARLVRRFRDAREAPPPPSIARAIDDIVTLLAGSPPASASALPDLAAVVLDMTAVPDFNRRVYAVTREILPGSTRTYGQVAARIGDPGAARAVGRALGENPFPIIVPCHRVLAAGGKTGGFSAHGGVSTKLRILAIEGARTSDEPTLFDALFAFEAPGSAP